MAWRKPYLTCLLSGIGWYRFSSFEVFNRRQFSKQLETSDWGNKPQNRFWIPWKSDFPIPDNPNFFYSVRSNPDSEEFLPALFKCVTVEETFPKIRISRNGTFKISLLIILIIFRAFQKFFKVSYQDIIIRFLYKCLFINTGEQSFHYYVANMNQQNSSIWPSKLYKKEKWRFRIFNLLFNFC